MQKRIDIAITGKVQGVFFRAFAQDEAQQRDINGFVENKPDGSVRIAAEGEERVLQDYLKALRSGPPAARVDHVSADWGEQAEGFENFTIRW